MDHKHRYTYDLIIYYDQHNDVSFTFCRAVCIKVFTVGKMRCVRDFVHEIVFISGACLLTCFRRQSQLVWTCPNGECVGVSFVLDAFLDNKQEISLNTKWDGTFGGLEHR